MYTANSSILYSKEKNCPDNGHPLTSILSECFWPPFNSKQIEFQEELIKFLRT